MYNTNPDCRKLIAEGKCKADCCGIVPMEYHKNLLAKIIVGA